MSPPLTLNEIRNFMLTNGGKVTNHDLVKHFKESLTHPDSQSKYTVAEQCCISSRPLILPFPDLPR